MFVWAKSFKIKCNIKEKSKRFGVIRSPSSADDGDQLFIQKVVFYPKSGILSKKWYFKRFVLL